MRRAGRRERRIVRLAWLALAGGLAACDSGGRPLHDTTNADIAGDDFRVVAPEPVSRIVDPERLVLRVEVGRNSDVPVDTEDGQRVVRTTLPRGRYTRIGVEWSYEGLVVARAERDVAVANGAGSLRVGFRDDEFDTTDDFDRDDRSNLAEFAADTDPRSAADPGGTLDDVELTMDFAVPVALSELESDLIATLDLDVIVNDRALPARLTGFGDRRRVSTTVPRGSEAFVTAVWRDGDRRLARVARRLDAGNGNRATIVSRAYDTGYDDDFDGLSNAEEWVEAVVSTAPDTADDAALACEISPFDTGCDIDSDGDGEPDSVERETSDSDGDAIPDYLESTLVDEDGDGYNAEDDVNESDPCAPDNRVEACIVLSLDSDGDGKLDADEGTLDTDGDGRPDRQESAIDDRDQDGTVDELDEDDEDPCVPNPIDERCL